MLLRVFLLASITFPHSLIWGGGQKHFRRLGKFARLGLADILVVKDGCAIFIEVKVIVVGSRTIKRTSRNLHAKLAPDMSSRCIDDVQAAAL
jgi:hypothetical protein